jgi:hypothetical protein
MSAQSLAAFRKSAGDDLANLAEQHLQHEYELHRRTQILWTS